MAAAKVSLSDKLPMADSTILVTARAFEATLSTQDADFEGIGTARCPASRACATSRGELKLIAIADRDVWSAAMHLRNAIGEGWWVARENQAAL